MAMSKHWVFRKMRSLEEEWSFSVKAGCLSDNQARALLQRLACEHLSVEEIINSSVRKNCKRYRRLLEVNGMTGSSLTFSLGENPWYTAQVEES